MELSHVRNMTVEAKPRSPCDGAVAFRNAYCDHIRAATLSVTYQPNLVPPPLSPVRLIHAASEARDAVSE